MPCVFLFIVISFTSLEFRLLAAAAVQVNIIISAFLQCSLVILFSGDAAVAAETTNANLRNDFLKFSKHPNKEVKILPNKYEYVAPDMRREMRGQPKIIPNGAASVAPSTRPAQSVASVTSALTRQYFPPAVDLHHLPPSFSQI